MEMMLGDPVLRVTELFGEDALVQGLAIKGGNVPRQ
jgi:hypothetical protein